jgi:hypothetical protein
MATLASSCAGNSELVETLRHLLCDKSGRVASAGKRAAPFAAIYSMSVSRSV